MISEALQKSREYEEKYEKFISGDSRPVFHLTPRVGWMNDPNGFCFYNGKYHLFYQYYPYKTKWGPMHWGHAVSGDMLRWEYLPAVLAPDMPYDKDGCFSGSAVTLPDGKHLLMYTGFKENKLPDGTTAGEQIQCLAVGDGLNYEKYSKNPVITGDMLPEGFSVADFRDPKIFREENGSYGCVVASRSDDGSGGVLLYKSADGYDWKFSSVLERCRNGYGLMWECPDFFELDGKNIIIVSPQDMNPIGLEFHNGNNTMCIIGEFNSDNNVFTRENIHALDYGLDFYAPQTTLAPDGRRIMIGWLQNWDTSSAPAGSEWFGQMSVPRELKYVNGRLTQAPIKEIEALRGSKTAYRDIPLQEEITIQGVFGRTVDITAEITPIESEVYKTFKMKLASGSQHYTMISYSPLTSTVKLDRSHSGSRRDFVHERECLAKNNGGRIKLRVIIDRFSVEVFINDGEQVMSAIIHTPQTADGISFECVGKAILSVEKYDISVNTAIK